MRITNLIIYNSEGQTFVHNLMKEEIKSNQTKDLFLVNYARPLRKEFTLVGEYCGYVKRLNYMHVYGLEDGCVDEIVNLNNMSVYYRCYNRPFLNDYYLEGGGLPFYLN